MKRKIMLVLAILLVGCVPLANRYGPATQTAIPSSPTLPNTPSPTVTSIPPTEYVVRTDLEKRTCPSVACANVGYYYEGDIILVEGWLNDPSLPECQSWAHIANESYWVCAEYIMKGEK